MFYTNKRNGKPQEIPNITVVVGDSEFRISEEHGKLIINKIMGRQGNISVFPKYANEIGII